MIELRALFPFPFFPLLPTVVTHGKEGEVIAFRQTNQLNADDAVDEVGVCEQPAAIIPRGTGEVVINRAYFVRQKLFNHKEGVFTQVFFDVPKALAVIDQATRLGEDDCFYYFQVTTLEANVEWAFSIQPTDSFSSHTIWSRRAGDTEWRMEDGEVVMAGINESVIAPAKDR